MSKKILFLLGILLTIIAGTILHWILNCDCAAKSRYPETVPTDNSIVAIPDEKFTVVVQAASDSADAGLALTGHADNTGNRDENISLGQERADHVKAYLVQNGIAVNRITCTSRGPGEPVADNGTPEGRAKNRRTVILIK